MKVERGDRIRLVDMPDDPNALPAGATGVVLGVTEMSYVGTQIIVKWDAPHEHRSLMVVIPPDSIVKVS